MRRGMAALSLVCALTLAVTAFWDATTPPRDDTPGLRISQFCVRCMLGRAQLSVIESTRLV